MLVFAGPAPALGATGETPAPSRDALLNIGRQFAKKIGEKLEEAEILLQGGDKLKLAQLRAGSVIPEGELLVMRGLAGRQKLRLSNDIIAMVINGRLMISLGEFASALDFAISVSPENGTAAGWYIREGQTFFLDVNKGEVVLSGESGKVGQNDAFVDGQDLLVSSMQLEKWFGLEINIDLSNLALQISGAQPLPVEERLARDERGQYAAVISESSLPPLNEPYRIAGKPYLDVALNATARKPGGGGTMSKRVSGTLIGAGDLAGLSSQTFLGTGYAFGNSNDHIINNLRQTFSRDDPDGRVLGIRRFSFGDIDPLPMPLVPGSGQEQGVRLSNRITDGYTSLGTTDVRGDAQPGWDVELYRNDNRVGQLEVGSDGQYNFQSVFLFAGLNKLRLIFYGPQGEIREETRDVYSGAGTGSGGAWDLSASRSNITTYNPARAKTAADGDLHLTARYEQNLGALGAARIGLASISRPDAGGVTRRSYLQTGYSANFMDTLLTSDSAYEAEGTHATNVVARRNFGKHQTGLAFSHESEDFSTDGSASFNSVQALANGPLNLSLPGVTMPAYAINSTYSFSSTGLKTLRLSGDASARIGSNSIGSNLQYTVTEMPGTGGGTTRTPAEDRLSGSTSARGSYERGRWRATAAYDVQPLALQSFFGSYTYPFGDNLEGVGEVTHEVASELTRLDVSANWLADRFTLSPRLSLDTERQVVFNTSLRFALAPNPYTGKYEMYRKNLSENGGVAARVFLDRNGDGLYTAGEEAVEEAELKSFQTNRRALTDAKGIAFIPDLARGFKTDVALNAATLPDPYYMSMDAGAALLPRPGVVTQMEFPVVISGEMDGQAEYVSGDGIRTVARNLRIELVAPDGTVEKAENAAYDGYWTLSGIRPGVYYLAAHTPKGAQKGAMLPRRVFISPEGSTLFGEAVSLEAGYDIPVRFSSVNPPPVGNRKTRVIRPEDIVEQQAFVTLGNFTSRLGLAFTWYKFRMRGMPFNKMFTLVTPVPDIVPDPVTARMTLTLKPKAPMTMEAAFETCKSLIALGHECGVSVVTRYRPLLPPPETGAGTGQKASAENILGRI